MAEGVADEVTGTRVEELLQVIVIIIIIIIIIIINIIIFFLAPTGDLYTKV